MIPPLFQYSGRRQGEDAVGGRRWKTQSRQEAAGNRGPGGVADDSDKRLFPRSLGLSVTDVCHKGARFSLKDALHQPLSSNLLRFDARIPAQSSLDLIEFPLQPIRS